MNDNYRNLLQLIYRSGCIGYATLFLATKIYTLIIFLIVLRFDTILGSYEIFVFRSSDLKRNKNKFKCERIVREWIGKEWNRDKQQIK